MKWRDGWITSERVSRVVLIDYHLLGSDPPFLLCFETLNSDMKGLMRPDQLTYSAFGTLLNGVHPAQGSTCFISYYHR